MLKNVPSLELMSLVNDSFFDDLVETVAFIRADPNLGTRTIVDSKIETKVFKRLGINLEFSIEKSPFPNGAVLLPPIDSKHVFVRPFSSYNNQNFGELISYFSDRSSRIGFVDTEKVQVGGVFSNIPIKVIITHGMMHPKFTNEEIAVVILHELGHAYTYFFYLLHTAMGNFISLATAAAAVGAKTDKEKITIIEKGTRVMGIDGVGVRELVDQNQDQLEQTLQSLYINQTKSKLRSETGFGVYEIRACEQLADWFMTKIHPSAAIHQATALEKMHRFGWKIAVETYYDSGKYMAQLAALTVDAASVAFKSANRVVVNTLIYDDNVDEYDKPSERVRSMRNSVIDSLKNSKLPSNVVNQLLATAKSLEVVEKRMLTYDDTPGWLIKFIRGVVIEDYRSNMNAIKLQKNIEQLMYNESYAQAAKLRGLSK